MNASPALGTADVYVLAPGSSLSSASATVSNLNFESASSYQFLRAGTYEVYLTQPGQKSAVVDSGPLTFTSQQIRTVVGLDGQSGGYETASLSEPQLTMSWEASSSELQIFAEDLPEMREVRSNGICRSCLRNLYKSLSFYSGKRVIQLHRSRTLWRASW